VSAKQTPIGWVIVDRETKKLDWDGELWPTESEARKSLTEDVFYNDDSWQPFEIYDICPVLADPTKPYIK
jgi:hypothetical protein